jgi:regulator of protease activity HflC (stomatin/prohibitin superfamily)
MQALIDFIVSNLLAMLPFVIVEEWECAMRVRFGKIIGDVKPGFVWRIPFLEDIVSEECTEQTLNLKTATITTTDEVSVTLSANISYRVVDIKKLWRNASDFDESLGNLLLGLLAHHCSKKTYDQLMHGRGRLEPFLVKKLTEKVDKWGVEIVVLHLTDFVSARPYKHYIDGIIS